MNRRAQAQSGVCKGGRIQADLIQSGSRARRRSFGFFEVGDTSETVCCVVWEADVEETGVLFSYEFVEVVL